MTGFFESGPQPYATDEFDCTIGELETTPCTLVTPASVTK
jgi:hypothetical protein